MVFFSDESSQNIPIPNNMVCKDLTNKKNNPKMPNTEYFMITNQNKYALKYYGYYICGMTTK
ncbi:9700_t:CDS:1, partial [Racocetra persica]